MRASRAHRVDKPRAQSQVREFGNLGNVEERISRRIRGRPVVHHQGCARRERGYLPVPHHPTGRGEEHQPIAGAGVGVQRDLDEVLDEHATGAMHEALRLARRTRREEHIGRVVERQAEVLRFGTGVAPLRLGQQVDLDEAAGSGDEARGEPRQVDDVGVDRAGRVVGAGHDKHGGHRRQLAHELHKVVAAVMALAVPSIGRGRDEHDRVELPEAIDDGGYAELR